jgi:hypothetical protein
MNKFSELQAGHRDLLKKHEDNRDSDELLNAARTYIKKVCAESESVASSRDRDQLRANLRFWASFVYDKTGIYPDTTLRPAIGTPPWIKLKLYGSVALIVLLGVGILLLALHYLLADQLPTAQILQPVDKSPVPYSMEVHGSYTESLRIPIFQQRNLWLVVRPLESDLYYPQRPIKIQDHTWSIGAHFGQDIPDEIGRQFDIFLYLADSRADQTLRKYVDDALPTDKWPGLQSLPASMTKLDWVRVTKIEVRIRQPHEGDIVPYDYEKEMISGFYAGDLAGRKIWVVVHPQNSDGYFPQRPTIVVSDTWSIGAHFGQDTLEEKGNKFDVIVYLADSKADQVLQEYIDKAVKTEKWPGLSLPTGLVEFHRVTVTRR